MLTFNFLDCQNINIGTPYLTCVRHTASILDTSYTGGNNQIIEVTGHFPPLAARFAIPEDVDYFNFASWNPASGRYRKVHKYTLEVLLMVQPDTVPTWGLQALKGTGYIIGQLRTTKIQVTRHVDLTMVRRYHGGG